MPFYTKNFRNTTRTSFARAAALDAFGYRAIHVLDEPDFADRAPLHYGRRRVWRWTP